VTPQNPAIGDVAMPGNPARSRPPEPHVPRIAAPPTVEEAVEAHWRVLDDWIEASDLRKVAQRKTKEAYKADILADADAVAAGGEPLPNSKRSEGKAKLAEVEADRNVAVLSEAGRKTAQRVTEAVCAARDEWIADLEQREVETAERVRSALAALTTATSELRAHRGAIAWLREVDVEGQRLPDHVSTGRLNVDVGGSNGIGARQHPVSDVLAALSTVADPPAPTHPRTHKTSSTA
jgi:hypothetical protein